MPETIATILSAPPVSGSVDEVWFDAQGDCTWVMIDVDEESWVGVFSKGALGQSTSCVFDLGRAVMIISAGQGYLIDAVSRKLLHKTECSFLLGAISIPDFSGVAAYDFCDVYLYSGSGKHWSQTVSGDGINYLKATSETVEGEAEDWMGKLEFVLNLADGRILN